MTNYNRTNLILTRFFLFIIDNFVFGIGLGGASRGASGILSLAQIRVSKPSLVVVLNMVQNPALTVPARGFILIRSLGLLFTR